MNMLVFFGWTSGAHAVMTFMSRFRLSGSMSLQKAFVEMLLSAQDSVWNLRNIVPLKQIEKGVHGDLIIIYPKPCSIYSRGTIVPNHRTWDSEKVARCFHGAEGLVLLVCWWCRQLFKASSVPTCRWRLGGLSVSRGDAAVEMESCFLNKNWVGPWDI